MKTIDKKLHPLSDLRIFQSYKSFSLLKLKNRRLSDTTKNWTDHIKKSKKAWD